MSLGSSAGTFANAAVTIWRGRSSSRMSFNGALDGSSDRRTCSGDDDNFRQGCSRIGDCFTWKKVEAKVQPAQPEIPPSSGMMVPVR
jgi:hypothetical protein